MTVEEILMKIKHASSMKELDKIITDKYFEYVQAENEYQDMIQSMNK
ncbi:MAG: hypothetical protein PHQ22_10560 [Sulfuricurvum sp.]|nr:hypothetical protein [Sulfuricurvum sp.]